MTKERSREICIGRKEVRVPEAGIPRQGMNTAETRQEKKKKKRRKLPKPLGEQESGEKMRLTEDGQLGPSAEYHTLCYSLIQKPSLEALPHPLVPHLQL